MNGQVVKKSKLNDDIKALNKLCREYQKEMPTQIKLVYDVAVKALSVDYCYEVVFSNDKNKCVVMFGMICNALKEISETHTGTNVAINVGLNVVTNEEKIIRHGANRNDYWV